MRLFRIAAFIACFGGLPAGADTPARVVSVNLCTDQLAMMLAAPGQLVSISRIALDPLTSAMAVEAAAYPVNSGRAEEVFSLEPDVVLAGVYTDPFVVQMLRDLGVEVVQFPLVTELAAIPGAVRQMGAVLGRSGTAEIVALGVEAELAEMAVAPVEGAPEAAFFFANGYSLGVGTLAHDIITRSGFVNLANRLGQSGGGVLSLEEVLLNRPDVLVTSASYPGASRSEEIMSHKALDGIARVQSGATWGCGTPLTLRAVAQMTAARAALE